MIVAASGTTDRRRRSRPRRVVVHGSRRCPRAWSRTAAGSRSSPRRLRVDLAVPGADLGRRAARRIVVSSLGPRGRRPRRGRGRLGAAARRRAAAGPVGDAWPRARSATATCCTCAPARRSCPRSPSTTSWTRSPTACSPAPPAGRRRTPRARHAASPRRCSVFTLRRARCSPGRAGWPPRSPRASGAVLLGAVAAAAAAASAPARRRPWPRPASRSPTRRRPGRPASAATPAGRLRRAAAAASAQRRAARRRRCCSSCSATGVAGFVTVVTVGAARRRSARQSPPAPR